MVDILNSVFSLIYIVTVNLQNLFWAVTKTQQKKTCIKKAQSKISKICYWLEEEKKKIIKLLSPEMKFGNLQDTVVWLSSVISLCLPAQHSTILIPRCLAFRTLLALLLSLSLSPGTIPPSFSSPLSLSLSFSSISHPLFFPGEVGLRH